MYLSIRSGESVYGVIGIPVKKDAMDSFEYSILLSVINECALAMENSQNAIEKEKNAILSKNGKFVILSSNDAKKDFEACFPQFINKAKVLQFVVPFENIQYDRKLLREKYGINGDFFFIPNNFGSIKITRYN